MKKNITKIIQSPMFIRFDKNYRKIRSIIKEGNATSFQETQLKKLLFHSYNNVPYYHKLLEGIDNPQNESSVYLDNLPILTKDIIRNNSKELFSDDYNQRNWYHKSSSGSTGEPIKFIQDEKYFKWSKIANYYYFKDIIGIDEPIAKKIILWGSNDDIIKHNISMKGKIYEKISQTKLLNSFKLRKEDIEGHIKIINSYKPELLRGYAGSLYEISKYAEKKNIEMYSPKVIISAAENLRDEMRECIEKTFGSKVYNFYGSREVSNLAGECEKGLLHLFTFWNNYEILNKDNKNAKIGEEGKIITTNLFNYSMPFIRYEIGDRVVKGPKKCKCGNNLPTIKKIIGRITDHFILENGTIIHSGVFIYLLGVLYGSKIDKFQVIQIDYNDINILVVLNEEMGSNEMLKIEETIKNFMGQNCNISWESVDEIPKTKSGKYIYTKSLII
jgi:phenylacetate-CoA ligase